MSRFLLALLLFLCTTPLLAQSEGESAEAEEIEIEDDDTAVEMETDYDYDYEYNGDDYEYEEPVTPWGAPRGGAGISFDFAFTGIDPATLDDDLDGTLVFNGINAYLLLEGLLLGGGWYDATLYEQPEIYEEFDFNYGGGLVGFDYGIFREKASIRVGTLIGSGGLKMIKKRPGLTADIFRNPSGNEILERFREQSFFLLRPGASIGIVPLPFLEFRLFADFFYPFGDNVDDLREPLYGAQIVFGRVE